MPPLYFLLSLMPTPAIELTPCHIDFAISAISRLMPFITPFLSFH